MPDYKDLYFRLMRKVSDAIDLLVRAQQECEDAFLDSGEDETSIKQEPSITPALDIVISLRKGD